MKSAAGITVPAASSFETSAPSESDGRRAATYREASSPLICSR